MLGVPVPFHNFLPKFVTNYVLTKMPYLYFLLISALQVRTPALLQTQRTCLPRPAYDYCPPLDPACVSWTPAASLSRPHLRQVDQRPPVFLRTAHRLHTRCLPALTTAAAPQMDADSRPSASALTHTRTTPAQISTDLSPTGKYTTIAPLVAMICIRHSHSHSHSHST